MKDLVIFGIGRLAAVVHYLLTCDGSRSVRAFTVDRTHKTDDNFASLPVLAFDELVDKCPPRECELLIAVGYSNLNRDRESVFNRAKQRGYTLASFVHSSSIVNNAEMGENCIILENNVIQPFARLGNNVIVWSSNVIGHHSLIGDHTFLTSGCLIAGEAEIGKRCFFGIGARVFPQIAVADDCIIGAGSVISRTAAAGGVYRQPAARRCRVASEQVSHLI